MKLLGGEGGTGLGGALLGVPQFRDGLGEGGKPDDHDRPLIGMVPAQVRVGGHDPGGLAELVARLGGQGDAAEGLAGRTLVEAGRLAQRAIAEHRGGDVQCVDGGLGGVGRCAGAGGTEGPDVLGGVRGHLRRVVEQGGALGVGELDVGYLPGGVPAQSELRPREVGGELPTRIPDGLAVLVLTSPSSATAYPVTWLGFFVL